jgi:hypothetical protein
LWAASVLAAHTSIESHDLVDQVEALGRWAIRSTH